MLIFTIPPSVVAGLRIVCAAWSDARYGDPDAVARCSHDGGRHWAALQRINDDPRGNGVRQYLPRLSLAPEGALTRSSSTDAAPLNIFNDVYFAFFTGGGRHFSANRQIDRYRSSSQYGAQYAGPAADGQYEFGGRLGLVSTAHSVLAAWPDTHNSQAAPAQDVFVTRVRLAGGRRPTSTRWAAGSASMAGATLLTVAAGARRRSGVVVAP